MRTPVMAGTLADFDLPSVMQVVGIGRQYTGVELVDDQGSLVGTMHLKSGNILNATSGSLSGLAAVTTLLRGSRERRFTVYRTEPFPLACNPLGSVRDILLQLQQEPHERPPPPERVPVLAGRLTDFDVASVLQVMGLGRQHTVLEVVAEDGGSVGSVALKSGIVVAARCGPWNGVDAIRALLRAPRESRFAVHRSRADVGPTHHGPLARILADLAAESRAGWDADEPDTNVLDRSRCAPPPAPRAPPAAPPARPAPPAAPAPTHAAIAPSPGAVRASPGPSPRARTPGASGAPVVCVTSPKGGAGKTTVTLNLGVAFARQGKRVVVVDADDGGTFLALDATAEAPVGAYDVVAGRARIADVAIPTRLPGLRVIPTGDGGAAHASSALGWSRLFDEARAEADIVLVDTSSGVRGVTADACAAATHTLVVLPAEPTAVRALPAHLHRLSSLRPAAPSVAGIVLNMLDYRAPVSLDALRDLCVGPSGSLLFDIPIARSTAFMDAVALGVPVCRPDRSAVPTIGWVFEVLASGILGRLGVAATDTEELPLI